MSSTGLVVYSENQFFNKKYIFDTSKNQSVINKIRFCTFEDLFVKSELRFDNSETQCIVEMKLKL